ncbi:MAG: ABC transporter permease [Silicimonas sp.]|nr:ABC transporter permease [Silicimonas sp.]
MFLADAHKPSIARGAYKLLDLTYHNTVRSIRKGHRDAVFAIVSNIIQTLVMVGAFYLFMSFFRQFGASSAIRGDFLLYVMSGIFVFMVHIKTLAAVAGADGPTSAIMQHLPMTTTVSLLSAAFSTLYTQIISLSAILLMYHLIWSPVEFHQPIGTICMILLAWFSGISVGVCFLAVKPWFPKATTTAQQIYTRFNMFASGKMFVANTMPATMIYLFSWNPLFHIIDQGRGFIFINYNPLKSNLEYPITVSVVLLCIGLIAESQTRKHVSVSWFAGR